MAVLRALIKLESGDNSCRRMKFRRRRRVVLVSAMALLSPESSIQAFVPGCTETQYRRSAPRCETELYVETGSESRTWDQTRHKMIYSGEYEDSPHRESTVKNNTPLPVVGYDASGICKHYDRRPLQVGWRMNSVGLPLLGWYVGLLTDRALGIKDMESVQRRRGAQLKKHLVQSGSVALIKSGQALSLRPDLIRNKLWAEELGKLVDAVGSFSDLDAMRIMKNELDDIGARLKVSGLGRPRQPDRKEQLSRVQLLAETDSVLSLFEFYNDNCAVASASIGQVYKARVRRSPELEAAIGKAEAAKWEGRLVAIKVQRPDVASSAALDMYLIRRSAMWMSKFRGGDLESVADQFGMQLFGELDYVREAHNCERFRELYGDWESIVVPRACKALTRKRVLVMDWVEGEKGPWGQGEGIEMVRTGLKCSVDQLMHTGLFHADPHLGNLLRTPDGKLGLIDFGMMADVSEEDRYGLIGLVIGLQNKDINLVTENLLKLGFLSDTTQLDQLVPRLRRALRNSTGGTGKTSDVNFGRLQAELDEISRENVLKFSTPPFFTIIIRSLTILEGVALSVDPSFRLVRGAYPYVLRQLLSSGRDAPVPAALQNLLVRLLTVNGEGNEIEWARLRDFLRLAQKAASSYNPSRDDAEDKRNRSRQTIELFFKFLTSRTGLFLKKPLVHELAEAIDGMASIGEANLIRFTRGLIRPLPGMNGPVNDKRIEELRLLLETVQNAVGEQTTTINNRARMAALMDLVRELVALVNDDRMRQDAGPIISEMQSVVQMVAVELLEIRGTRAVRSVLRLEPE